MKIQKLMTKRNAFLALSLGIALFMSFPVTQVSALKWHSIITDGSVEYWNDENDLTYWDEKNVGGTYLKNPIPYSGSYSVEFDVQAEWISQDYSGLSSRTWTLRLKARLESAGSYTGIILVILYEGGYDSSTKDVTSTSWTSFSNSYTGIPTGIMVGCYEITPHVLIDALDFGWLEVDP
ncbi:MAG: hypothetical protein ACFFFG_18360 [Candidatus Thorarchaeota archaeon]